MYGTVMVGRLRGSIEDVTLALKDWQARGLPPGYVGSEILLCDDGETLVSVVRFADRASYLALAGDPGQDEWWRMRMQPLLDGEPRWIDGTWAPQGPAGE